MTTDLVAVVASEAWSEPASGCYALWLRVLAPPAGADLAARQLVASIEDAGFAVRDVSVPPAGRGGVLKLGFATLLYRGLMRAVLAGDGELAHSSSGAGMRATVIDAVVCAWNQREPSTCAPACATFVGAVR